MSKGFVVYRDWHGWFRWCTAKTWDAQHPAPSPASVESEVGRYPTLTEARDVRHAYNMMVHGKPTPNDTYNKALERKGAQS